MKLSFILPAYNCAAFVKEAAVSVLSCPDPGIELIAVDDGSRDATRAVLDNLASVDARLRVYTIPNGGPANARNFGLTKAAGEYIGFLDADDAFAPGAVDRLLTLARDCDVLVFGFTQTFEDRAEPVRYLPHGTDTASLLADNMLNSVWNKLYRASFLREYEIAFPDLRWGEDRLFNFACVRAGASIRILPETLYDYRMDGGVSLVSGFLPDKPEICARVYREMRVICPDATLTAKLYLKSLLSCCTVLYADNCPLTFREKLLYIRRLQDLPETEDATRVRLSGYYGVIRRLFRYGMPQRVLGFARTVAFTQKRLLPLFLRFRG